jgi:lanthanide-dependent methanol dehydrogenase
MTCRGKLLLIAGAVVGLVGLAGPSFANSDIVQREQNPNLWPVTGGNYGLNRYSSLSDINKDNVGHLQMAWSQSSGALRGHEGQPLVVDVDGKPMMYIVSAWPNIVQALDLSDPDNPKEVWNYEKRTDRDESAVPRACCDTVNRGLSYASGKVVFGTLDGFVIALDARTGKEIWVVKHAYPEHGETQTNAPMIAENLVIAGFGGDEFAARGRLDAYDLDTGKLVWSKESNGRDDEIGITADTNKDNNRHDKTQNQGFTYPGDEWKRGGGSPWAWYSYDPELKLIYESNGNPGNWSPTTRCGENPPTQEGCNSGKWDNKWSMTIFARHVEDGTVAWNYQMTPFDQWDYDGVNENILVDMPNVDGKPHKTLVHFDRNGFAYVIDRETGELLRAHKFVTVNWAERVDLQTGRPVKVYEHSPLFVGHNTQACPSAMGGKDQQPAAVDPNDPEWFYTPTNNWCMEDNPQQRVSFQQGTVYVFANVYMYEEKPGVAGRFKKFNVLTGKEAWDIPDPYPNWGGALVTKGGLAFYGSLNGDFRAVDRDSGDILWHRKLASGIIGNPIAYKVNGKEYISVWSGIGGWIGLPVTAGLDMSDKFGAIGATAMAKATGLPLIPQGGTLFTFRVY